MLDTNNISFLSYYYANVDKTQQKIKEMLDNGKWDTDKFPKLKKNLLKILNIQHITNEPIDETTLRRILKEMKD
jgi:hypothetical protein